MKRCNKCGETKPINLFSKDKHKYDGLQTYCTQCCLLDQARRRQLPRGRAIALMSDARCSSKKRKLKIDISNDWVEEKLKKGVCELTGIPFDFGPSKNTYLNKCAPSLDRINSNKGYTKDNVRVVLCAVNNALGQYSDEEILPILKALVRAIEKNAKQDTTTPVPAGSDQQGDADSKRRAVFAARLGEDRNHPDDHSGAIPGQDADHRTQASSGDGVGHGVQEMEALIVAQSIEATWPGEPKVIWFKPRGGRIPD